MATIKDVRDLYRRDNKYWKTGDTDFLPARSEAGKEIAGDRFDNEVCGIARICTQKHFPVQKLVDVLKMLGFEITDDDEQED